jgi:hypothetical protein
MPVPSSSSSAAALRLRFPVAVAAAPMPPAARTGSVQLDATAGSRSDDDAFFEAPGGAAVSMEPYASTRLVGRVGCLRAVIACCSSAEGLEGAMGAPCRARTVVAGAAAADAGVAAVRATARADAFMKCV